MRYFQIEHKLLGRFGKMEMELAAGVVASLVSESGGRILREQVVQLSSFPDRTQVLFGFDELVARGFLVAVGDDAYQATEVFRERIRSGR